jgi:hypothetical protein
LDAYRDDRCPRSAPARQSGAAEVLVAGGFRRLCDELRPLRRTCSTKVQRRNLPRRDSLMRHA